MGLKKFWNWLWYSNSIASWLASFFIAFLLVKFVIYPVIGFSLGTALPLVVIESGSMHHLGTDNGITALVTGHAVSDFDKWWRSQEENYEDFEITKSFAEQWPFSEGLSKGDIIVVKGKPADEFKVGDVIVFKPETGRRAIIHRIVNVENSEGENGESEGGSLIISTKGDANIGQIPLEKEITAEQIEGVAVARLPSLGWVKLFFVDLLR